VAYRGQVFEFDYSSTVVTERQVAHRTARLGLSMSLVFIYIDLWVWPSSVDRECNGGCWICCCCLL